MQCFSSFYAGKESSIDAIFLSSSYIMDLPYLCHFSTEYNRCVVCNVCARH